MAAPHVSGVAALMVAEAPNLSAAELRAQLLERAARAPLPVSSGYLDALGSVRGVLGASDATLGQPPRLRVLAARTAGTGRRARSLDPVPHRRIHRRRPPLPRHGRRPAAPSRSRAGAAGARRSACAAGPGGA